MIKDKIKHYENIKFKKYYLQAISISIDNWNGPLPLVAVYSPSRHTITAKDLRISSTRLLGPRFRHTQDIHSGNQD